MEQVLRRHTIRKADSVASLAGSRLSYVNDRQIVGLDFLAKSGFLAAYRRHILKPDPPWKAVARAYRWSNDLVSGRVRSIEQIAKQEDLTGRYVRRVMGLAFLAPRIVEAIAEGRQPADLTTVAMTQRIDLPPLWSAQERALDLR